MAIVSRQRKRYEIPHEPGEWMELRGVSNGDMIAVGINPGSDADETFEGTVELFGRLIVAWSYAEEVTPENVRLLDMETTTWLGAEVLPALLNPAGDAEKNGSTTSS